ncbi:MAG TPA: polynucleotide adenylyltransferase PcnB [Vicinamibacterales bacterium]|jgi:poly(A) polymerase|nr:polynucleotide adenylyltransferase PcnB [Vicinamibacterales bacterium]
MGEPKIVPRPEHALSRKLIDPEALKVLYRLNQSNYTAYLVGGSVRDLLLGRKPKDFDIGTSAHPYEVKKLFRNCWIIGRRFRLAHVRFGEKTIEVATFRRQVSAEEAAASDSPLQTLAPPESDVAAPELDDARDRLIHRDNTFGTPEQDAFRRDFTINALFYDIETFSIIDYTGGLEDLQHGIVRCIGVPEERFQEDPVRMLRAVAMAARLNFTIDAPIEAAIAAHRNDIARSAPARLIEEFYKLLRSGAAERAFRMLAEHRLLGPISEELQADAGDALWQSLAALDAYRNRHESAPDTLTNPILLGSLLMPIPPAARAVTHPPRWTEDMKKEPRISLGLLPLARRDIERLRQILGLQRRLVDAKLAPRARRVLMHKGTFREALTWLEIHGQAPEAVAEWRAFVEHAGAQPAEPGEAEGEGERPRRRRRRRRGRRRPPPALGT